MSFGKCAEKAKGIRSTETLVSKVLEKLFSVGFLPAQNGEFTKRAYLNGKTNLSKAEGLADLINAESFAGMRAASILSSGKLCKETFAIQESLTDALARLEAALDYPEEDLEETELSYVKETLLFVCDKLNEILSTAQNGKRAKDGVKIAIVGDTNVGKSSLLNAIVGFDRAIVSDQKGTTRDTVEESIDYKGIKMTFIDTAGQRETQDEIEKIGVLRAKKAMQQADLIVYVCLDGKRNKVYCDTQTPVIIVKNKADLNSDIFDAEIAVSALTGQNVQLLLSKIYDKIGGEEVLTAPLLLTSQRQAQCLSKAKEELEEAILLVENNATADIVAAVIRRGWSLVGQVTGNTDMQTVVDAIFAKFCLGK